MQHLIHQLPSFPLVNQTDICVIGDVTIHPHAIIAPGVVIQATENSQVIIEAGACIGMGAVIKAYQGKIVLEQGSIVGARVLIIGKSTIGTNACIGVSTTIFNSSVDAMKVIEGYSVLGDFSRVVNLDNTEEKEIQQEEITSEEINTPEEEKITSDKEITPKDVTTLEDINTSEQVNISEEEITPKELKDSQNEIESKISEEQSEIDNKEIEDMNSEIKEVQDQKESSSKFKVEPEIETVEQNLQSENSSKSTKTPVVGQIYINNLLLTLFPHRQSINIPSKDDNQKYLLIVI